ncbi:MAG: 4-hydroxy-tetrahydrodipicolinate synthase [Deltaproteobacteria bacterium]|nr:4-hydroxy-tetrahydrodipicolinate synthase [Deltaproteobacteria bacterium]
MLFAGAFTALVTPFKNGAVDEDGYREFIEWQIEQGIDGLVPCGTTGESATLSHAEHERVITICIDQVKKRVPVIAGAGSNNTAEAVSLLKFARKAGADAGLMITPYYNKPTQEGVFQHFKAVAAACDLPVFVYNVPGRTGMNVSSSTMIRIRREIPSVIGAKEASADLTQIADIMQGCDADFILLSGDDFTALPIMALGGKGVISVSANVAPQKVAAMCRAWKDGDTALAAGLHYDLLALNHACFYETNPIPVKTMLSMLGRMSGELRLPLVPPSPENREKMREVLRRAGLL